jgi:hypothetical protein
MGEAIWYVIEGEVYVLCGALLALYVILSLLSILFHGERTDFWSAWNLRKGGDISGIDSD